jgi:hypothetical protein
MRHPERIPELLELIRELWARDPDLRFNQLVYNLQREYSYQNNNIGKIIEVASDGYESVGFDFFSLEDNVFIEFLKTKI